MKRNSFKRTLAVVLVLIMALSLFAGCKKKGDDPSGSGADYVYVPDYVSLPDGITDMYNACVVGDTIYFTSQVAVYPDGSLVPQEDMDAYNQLVNEYYETYYGSGTRDVAVYSTAASGTDIAAEDDTADEPDATQAPAEESEPIPDWPEQNFSYEYRMYSVKVDGTDLRYLDEYAPIEKPEGDYTYANVERLIADGQGNLFLLERISQTIFDLPEGYDASTGDNIYQYYVKDENSYYIRKISETGAVVSSVCLNDFVQNSENLEYFYVYYFGMDKDGNIFFNDDNRNLYVAGADGTLTAKLSFDGWINGYITLGDGSVAVALNTEDGKSVIKTVDLASRDWGETYDAPVNAYDFLPGGDAYDFCYTTSMSLFGYDLETQTETKIVTWLNNDIDGSNLRSCLLRANGDIFIISSNYSSDKVNYEVINLIKTPASEVKQKTPISLATFYLDWNLRSAVLDFNKTNPDYRIEVRDYSEYNTQDDYTAGLTKLNTEIISGNIPDILAVNQLPYKQYAAKGLLEDLYAYIDNDSELSRDNLVESIFKAMEDNGKLYSIGSNFSVISTIGKASLLGTEPGWTMKEFMEFIKEHPEADTPLGMYMTRENVFSSFCAMNLESYVNWITGECHFDTDDFKSLLEFAKSFPTSEEMDYENIQWVSDEQLIAEGRMLVSFFNLYSFDSFQDQMIRYGGDMVFKGLPGVDGGGSVASVEGGLAMTTSCKNKEAAWSFMRTVLTEKYQENMWGLPTNKSVFDKKLAEAMKQEYDTNGDPIPKYSMWVEGGDNVDVYALTQAEADQIMVLINSINHTYTYDQTLLEIINEQTEAYFAGDKSVDETASLIQSRMSLYINEQR